MKELAERQIQESGNNSNGMENGEEVVEISPQPER